MATKKKSTALAVSKPKSVAPAAPSYIKDSGRGTEGINSADVTLPFLRLGNEKTPQVENEIIEQGQFFNSVTNEVFGESVDIIVLAATTGQMRFGKYEKQEGILCQAPNGVKALKPEGKDAKGKPTDICANCVYKDWNDDEKPACMKQGKFLVMRPGSPSPMLLVLQSTNFPAARKINSILLTAGADTFANHLRLTHSKGAKSEVINVQKIGWVTESDFKAAEKLYATASKLFVSKLDGVSAAD